ncbi:MAG: hypothetical protein VKO21_12665 [Candidatus Sericytochromatia bacterium]|nr:hypothetical protein [Candidatus Sericytochromatia bacterium]
MLQSLRGKSDHLEGHNGGMPSSFEPTLRTRSAKASPVRNRMDGRRTPLTEQPAVMSGDRMKRSTSPPGQRLLVAMRAWADQPGTLPRYVAGLHPNWKDDTDHCYSLVFRGAIRAGLMTEAEAEALMARVPVGNESGFREVMFPKGFLRAPVHLEGERVHLGGGPWPAGALVSFDGGSHVMVATGRTDAEGRHEVLSFKGGQAATPVWGDSMPQDDQPRLHVLTAEEELENLLRDDQNVTDVFVAVGSPPWGR